MMNNITVYDELILDMPEGFHVMNDEELTDYFGNTEQWAIRDAERHIVISVVKTKPSLALSVLTDAKSVAKGVESNMRKRLIEYVHDDDITTQIAGKKTSGYRFSFKAKDADIRQSGEILVFKNKKCFYVLQYYTWTELNSSNIGIWRELTDSACIMQK